MMGPVSRPLAQPAKAKAAAPAAINFLRVKILPSACSLTSSRPLQRMSDPVVGWVLRIIVLMILSLMVRALIGKEQAAGRPPACLRESGLPGGLAQNGLGGNPGRSRLPAGPQAVAEPGDGETHRNTGKTLELMGQ